MQFSKVSGPISKVLVTPLESARVTGHTTRGMLERRNSALQSPTKTKFQQLADLSSSGNALPKHAASIEATWCR
jgi:hypothetical protein